MKNTNVSFKSVLVSFCVFLFIAGHNFTAIHAEEIDWQRARSLLKKFKSGETLTPEETKYLNDAKKARRAKQPNAKNNRPVIKPTHMNVSYGSHKEQAFDIWLAESKDGKLTPLCIFIHGGGFRGGDKSRVDTSAIRFFLDKGISFASMNYRLTANGKYPYPTAMLDSARGLQTIRSKAKEWDIDKTKIVAYGGSAGAGISLWLAFHDDLAQPESDDPVARESTRLIAAGTLNGQSTYDYRTYCEWFGGKKLTQHSAMKALYDIKNTETIESERIIKLMEDASPITHLTPDDVPVFMAYSRGDVPVDEKTNPSVWVHHVRLGHKLKEAMSKINLECTVVSPDEPDKKYETLNNFLASKLLEN